MKLAVANALIRLLSKIPLRLLHGLAVPIGWLAWLLPWRKHAVISTNLALCFPELDGQARRHLHRRHLVEMMRLVLESGAVWYWPQHKLEDHIRSVDGWEQVTDAHAEGRGVMVVAAHFGNWEILPLYISTLLPLTALYRAPSDPRVNEIITTTRSRFGASLIPSGSPAMRKMIAALRNGGVIGIMCDQQPKQGDGVFAPFFDTPALTMTLVNRLALRTGAAVIFATVERLPGQGWALRFSRADERIRSPEAVTGIASMHDWLEAEIRVNPAQYLWSYKRFGIRPEGEAEIYPLRRKSTRP